MSDWPTTAVRELVTAETGKREKGGARTDGGAYSIGGEQITTSGRLDLHSKPKFVSFDFFSGLKQGRVRAGDVLLVKDGATTGKAAWLPKLPSEQLAVNEHVFVLRSSDLSALDNGFLYFFLCSEQGQGQIKSRYHGLIGGINRGALDDIRLPLPPLPEQRKIAGVLGLVQRAMEQQERLLALTTELKKAVLHQLFTHGLRHEPQKQTELGPIPQSWDVVELGSLATKTDKVNLRTEDNREIEYVDVSGISREFLTIESSASYLLKDAPGRARKKIKESDVIFATVRPTLLRVARVPREFHNQVCSTAFCVLRDANEQTAGRFIYYLVQRQPFLKQLAAIESGANYPAITDRQLLAQKVPRPTESEQIQIANRLEAIDGKLAMHRRKHAALSALFRTLLHELITARIRVHDVDLSKLLDATK
jgi:type I restriction enzyme S subunit